jgi:thioredoxin reductase (NADPH)
VFYGATPTEAKLFTGADVFVVGGANSAGQAAVHLSKYASSVTLVHRGDSLASSMSQYLIEEIRATKNVVPRLSTEVVGVEGEDRLEAVTLKSEGTSETVRADALFVLIGAEPRTEWLPEDVVRDGHGFVVTGGGEHMFETSVPGVFAIGDVRSGSVKRVASAVGEGSVVIQQVHRRLAQRREAVGSAKS